MSGEFVTREECERAHAPINEFRSEFKKETNDNFIRVHARLDKINLMIVGVLLSIIASIAVQLIDAKTSTTVTPKLEVKIDSSALKAATQQ